MRPEKIGLWHALHVCIWVWILIDSMLYGWGCSSVVERMLCMNEAPGSVPGISMDYYVVMYVSECIFQRGSMTIFTHTGWHKNASAGNRTRVNCLEGSYAHHYTTDALQYIKVATKWKFFCSARKRRKSVKPNFNQRLMDFCSTEQLQSTSLTTELSKL